ncbi:MAG: hypothetical protein V4760_09380 [Bdellovibrionota bacterium]
MRRSFDFIFILLIAGLLSFCSMGYELLLARLLGSLTSDAVLAQSLTVGCFLLALGLGAWTYGKAKPKSEWTFLANLEIVLAIVAAVALPLLAISSMSTSRGTRFIVAAQVITVIIGFLSGAELPALISAARNYSRRAFGWVLAANYLGALCVSILLPRFLVPAFGLYMLSWVFALLTALAAGLVFLRSMRFNPSLRWPGLIIALILPPLFARHHDDFEQFYLKSFYYVGSSSLMPAELQETLSAHRHLPRIRRYSSPYQEIDIVEDDQEAYGMPKSGDFHLFIDQRYQFGSHTEPVYHDTMVHGAINLARTKPATVLVIGGGDGLVAKELLEYPEVKSITLVELDAAVIRLAKDYPPLRALNRGALEDPRLHVVIADGFEWLRRGGEGFDAIFIDLPHPNSIDLSRLYSVEFYEFTKRRLNDGGFVIVDFPASSVLKGSARDAEMSTVIAETLRAAGFGSVAAFGFWESFFIASASSREFQFDYESLDPYVSDVAAFNFALVDVPRRPVRINSIFKPKVLKVRLDGNG